jgi:hypothetical protein
VTFLPQALSSRTAATRSQVSPGTKRLVILCSSTQPGATASWSSGFFADAMLGQPYGLTVCLPRPTLTGVAAGVSSQSEGCPGHPCPLPADCPCLPRAPRCRYRLARTRAWSQVPSVISKFLSYFTVKITSCDWRVRAQWGARVGLLSVLRFIPIGRHSSRHWQGVRPCVQRAERRRAAGCGSRSHDRKNHRGRPKRRT